MRRFLPILLCALLLLSVACAERKTFNVQAATESTPAGNDASAAVPAGSADPGVPDQTATQSEAPTPEPTEAPTPEPTKVPEPILPPMLYDAWSLGTAGDAEIETFHCDLDQDGETETVFVYPDKDAHTCTVTDGKRTIVLEDGCVLDNVILCDLDPTNPWLNLVVVLGEDISEYVTVELHPDGDTFARGATFHSYTTVKNGTIAVLEEAYLLGWSFGYRHRSGEDMHPVEEWVTLKYIPDETDIAENWDMLVKWGDVLHVARALPCTIDGEPATLPVGTYLIRLRYRDTLDLMEVQTLEGVVAEIAFTFDGETYLIDGVPQAEYFDLLPE